MRGWSVGFGVKLQFIVVKSRAGLSMAETLLYGTLLQTSPQSEQKHRRAELGVKA